MMKTIKDINFSSDNFFSKNDKVEIVEFVNNNAGLFTGNHMVGEKVSIFHHKTNLQVLVCGAGMLSISKYVDGGLSYQYNCYANFIVK